jgi:integrase
MHRAPKASTIGNHNAAMARVFDVAIERGYMAHSQVPVLTRQVRDSERRPDFSLSEYRQLYRFMRHWIGRGKGGKSRDMRVLLRDYVLILANTGMRHGTESYGLKWKHITAFENQGVRYLGLWVKGKTGARELVARHRCVTYLQRIHQNTQDIAHLTWDELLAKGVDKFVFRLPDGTQSKSLHQTFEVLLKDAGLLIDRRTDKPRTLYSLRHMYATLALVKGQVDIHTLAKQMGTSALMIERHYSHLIPRQRARDLAGRLGAADLAGM